jgi:carbonic anhydrase
MKNSTHTQTPKPRWPWLALLVLGWMCATGTQAADKKPSAREAPPTADVEAKSSSDPKKVGAQVREALGLSGIPNKKLTLVIGDKNKVKDASLTDHAAPLAKTAAKALPPSDSEADRQFQAARAKALGHAVPKKPRAAPVEHSGEVHWSYDGNTGPQAWAKLEPGFNLCAVGRRQSPINIEDGSTLQGPAEMIQFKYTPSNATVVNNGHTIQVDVEGDNSITVRATRYRLVQFHFHTPSEEQINFRRSAMVAHLVHKSEEGQLAVVAVLLDIGEANALIDKVWTYMPLDSGDRVRMPPELLNLQELLPSDQRYYQFMGSLTTPPCSEGVLWMVFKQPATISKGQHKLFTQIYPFNARPVQPINGRPIRDAQ